MCSRSPFTPAHVNLLPCCHVCVPFSPVSLCNSTVCYRSCSIVFWIVIILGLVNRGFCTLLTEKWAFRASGRMATRRCSFDMTGRANQPANQSTVVHYDMILFMFFNFEFCLFPTHLSPRLFLVAPPSLCAWRCLERYEWTCTPLFLLFVACF